MCLVGESELINQVTPRSNEKYGRNSIILPQLFNYLYWFAKRLADNRTELYSCLVSDASSSYMHKSIGLPRTN